MAVQSTQPARSEARRVTRREALLDQAVRELGPAGVHEASLRAIAAALGTSHRMLLYYFGTKDELMARLRERVENTAYRDLPLSWVEQGVDPLASIDATWAATLDDDRTKPRMELLALALLHPDEYGLAEQAELARWVESLVVMARSAGIGATKSEAIATLVVATLRGLQLDYAITGDAQRTGKAVAEFKALLALWTLEQLGLS